MRKYVLLTIAALAIVAGGLFLMPAKEAWCWGCETKGQVCRSGMDCGWACSCQKADYSDKFGYCF